jgi:hypothetical protein
MVPAPEVQLPQFASGDDECRAEERRLTSDLVRPGMPGV